MKHLFTAVLALAAMSAGAQNDDSNKIYDLSTGRDGSRMFVNMTVNPKEIHQKINSRLEIKPVLWAADSSRSVEFPSVTVAGKNMYYYDLRDNDSTMNLYRAGKGSRSATACRSLMKTGWSYPLSLSNRRKAAAAGP